MEQRFNIYFSGELLPGHAAQSVRENLGRLFNADRATLDRLFSGNTMLLKKNCDEATAARYRQAMERAGARAVIRSLEAATPAPAPTPAKPVTTAERIAALTAEDEPPPPPPAAPAASTGAGDALSIAAAGTPVLREEERSTPEIRQIDTSTLTVDQHAERLSPEPGPAPPAPDTGHLTLGATGDPLPTVARDPAPPPPDISGLDLAAAGADFTDCARPEASAPELDLSALVLCPAGVDVLEEQYRRQPAVGAPDTGHIRLQD